MKKSLFVVIFLIFSMMACQVDENDDKISIEGNIKNSSSETIYLKIISSDDIITLDSTKTSTNGSFKFDVQKPKSFDFYYLTSNHFLNIPIITMQRDNNIILNFNALKPLESVSYKNSIQSDKLIKLIHKNIDHKNLLDSVYSEYRKQAHNQEVDFYKFDSIIKNENLNHYQHYKQTIASDAVNPYTIMALYLKVGDKFLLNAELDFDLFKLVKDSLKRKYPENFHITELENRIGAVEIKKQTQEKIEERLSPGNLINSISGLNPNEGLIELSNIDSEKILVLFWKTTNKDSWELIQNLKRIYNVNNNNKFEIFAISMDSDKLNWKNSLKAFDIKWKNALGSANYENDFNIQKYPKYFLVDSDFKIIAKNPDLSKIKELIE